MAAAAAAAAAQASGQTQQRYLSRVSSSSTGLGLGGVGSPVTAGNLAGFKPSGLRPTGSSSSLAYSVDSTAAPFSPTPGTIGARILAQQQLLQQGSGGAGVGSPQLHPRISALAEGAVGTRSARASLGGISRNSSSQSLMDRAMAAEAAAARAMPPTSPGGQAVTGYDSLEACMDALGLGYYSKVCVS